ncbi:hypothetical protein [Anaerocolumna sp. MB42-C2]|uniref:hypothetical protein n=1 Tax=Anaerocolumna sp. MB42-C2 TaxID=3070997 RepID=UPI0027E172CC|nr:hypothetical protein [Anaerocolumna sp. MB42-C2]WMJ87378.1 hypothetical protein RBU59_25625 [Anaerocolumna sp. MB42-C2]
MRVHLILERSDNMNLSLLYPSRFASALKIINIAVSYLLFKGYDMDVTRNNNYIKFKKLKLGGIINDQFNRLWI